MNEIVSHYHIDSSPSLEKELWNILTEKFDVKINRRCHSEDGLENNVWVTIEKAKTKD